MATRAQIYWRLAWVVGVLSVPAAVGVFVGGCWSGLCSQRGPMPIAVLAVSAVVFLVAIGFSQLLVMAHDREVWREVAEDLALAFGTRRSYRGGIDSAWGGFHVYTDRARNRGDRWRRIHVVFPRPLDLGIDVRSRATSPYFFKEAADIPPVGTGDPEFDARYVVRATHGASALHFLDARRRSALLYCLANATTGLNGGLVLRDDALHVLPGPAVRLSADRLSHELRTCLETVNALFST